MTRQSRSMLRAILDHPTDASARLGELRAIVAERLDATDSARETASLARVMLDVEAALRSLAAGPVTTDVVDDLIARRTARGAK